MTAAGVRPSPAQPTLRVATPADAALLVDLGRRSFAETFGPLYAPADLAAFLATHTISGWDAALNDPATRVMIAEAGGVAAGYARVGPPTLPFAALGHPVELRQFYVLAPWHGSGLAHRMIDQVFAAARALGGTSLWLSVFVDNHRARAFYDRYGFTFVQRYAFMVGTHADEDLILRCDL